MKITPHQFRHLAAKIALDANPGAYELVRQLLGHKNLRTTTNNYAGIDTRRAGRAHADLIMKLRESTLGRAAPSPDTSAARGLAPCADRKPRLHLPYSQWPAADRLLWERAMGSDDPFADAAGAHLAKASQHNYLFAWRRFLGFLAINEPTALEVAPSERLTIERIRSFVAHLAETNTPQSVAVQVDALYLAARVMMPERDWTWLKAIKARLYRAAPAHARRGPVITSVQLLDLGQQLMDESKPTAATPIRMADAVRYRDGLMIAFLAFIPIRRKNLAALEIGRHLVREGDRWFVIIPREEAKTGTPIEFPVPELLNPYLAFYLDIVRPRMLRRPTCSALWVSAKGGRSRIWRDRASFQPASRRAASASASLLTTHVMRRQQRGLFQRPIRSALPATCLRTAICAPLRSTTIGREGSKPVVHIGS